MNALPKPLHERLEALAKRAQKRQLTQRAGLDISSNDYLGFATDPELGRRFLLSLMDLPQGSTGSRLLRGNHEIFEKTEKLLAAFSGREQALLFPSGYQANLGLLSAILGPEDLVLSDQLNHASIVDGIRLSRATKRIYPHRDIAVLRALLEQTGSETTQSAKNSIRVIITESLFGMEGTIAPLSELAALAMEHSALLIVDESHATGLWGEGGGLVRHFGLTDQVFATVHTGGKALGAGGAWIAGSAALKNYLVSFSRPFIFSSAPIPALAALLGTSIEYWREVGSGRARRLLALSKGFQMRLGARPILESPVVPVLVGENEVAISLAASLRSSGFDARAIRPPTVPEGTARLRISLNSNLHEEELKKLSDLILAHHTSILRREGNA